MKTVFFRKNFLYSKPLKNCRYGVPIANGYARSTGKFFFKKLVQIKVNFYDNRVGKHNATRGSANTSRLEDKKKSGEK